MAARARLLVGTDLRPDCERVVAPTAGHDRGTRARFRGAGRRVVPDAQLIPGARHVVLPRTGHQGPITRPDEFARIVRDFVAGSATRWPHAAA